MLIEIVIIELAVELEPPFSEKLANLLQDSVGYDVSADQHRKDV